MTTPFGSMIVSAFERAWAAIQDRNPEVPDVVFITGGGIVPGGLKWGHFGANHWDTAEGKAHELFVSGEALTRPAHETLCTLLHEAAHALNHVRNEQGTSRRNAYHNKTFVKAATELGLAWPEGTKPHPTIGFSSVVITEATREEYVDTIAQLEADKVAWRALAFTLPTGGGEDGDDSGNGGDGTRVAAPKKPRSKNTKPKAVCGCEEDNAIYASRRTLETKRPMCGVCGERYEIHPDFL